MAGTQEMHVLSHVGSSMTAFHLESKQVLSAGYCYLSYMEVLWQCREIRHGEMSSGLPIEHANTFVVFAGPSKADCKRQRGGQ